MAENDDICPACKGSGEDPSKCGCRCLGQGKEAGPYLYPDCGHTCCSNCMGYGCGGSCPFCGGTGKRSSWQEGNPTYEGYELSTEKDAIA